MFDFCRQIRLASVVVQLTGVIFHNMTLMLIGLMIMAITYQWSIDKIEKHFDKKEKEDALRREESSSESR